MTTPEQRLESIRASLRAGNVSEGSTMNEQRELRDREWADNVAAEQRTPDGVSLNSRQERAHRHRGGKMTTIVLDWDGTLHEHAHYAPRFGRVSLALIAQAHARGYPVAISTCNDIWRVSEYLRDHGYATLTDHNREYGQCGWDGGRGGHVILVTNLKVSGYLIDDRAFNYHYGSATGPVWEQVQDAEEAKHPAHGSSPASCAGRYSECSHNA